MDKLLDWLGDCIINVGLRIRDRKSFKLARQMGEAMARRQDEILLEAFKEGELGV